MTGRFQGFNFPAPVINHTGIAICFRIFVVFFRPCSTYSSASFSCTRDIKPKFCGNSTVTCK